MHEAHNLKLGDLEAEHHKVVHSLQDDLNAAASRSSELQEDVTRKQLEIKYLEQDIEEKDDTITRYVKTMNNFVLSRFPVPKFLFRFFRYDRGLPV